MKAVVACVDFSDATPAVVETAVSLAAALAAPLHLLHVGEPEPDFIGYQPGPSTVRDQVAHELRDRHRRLQELSDGLRARGLDARPLMARGPYAETILERAAHLDAGLLVLGSHGHGALRALLVGSVTGAVLKASTVPVVVVPARAAVARGK